METFGDKIKNIRIKENLKQSELADMLFVSEKTISSWENNRTMPDLNMIYNIAKQFKQSFYYLISDDYAMGNDEIEIKLKVNEIEYNKLLDFIKDNSISKGSFNIIDTYYLIDKKSNNNFLRLRDVNGKQIFSYKKKIDDSHYEKYDVLIDNAYNLNIILEALGIKKIGSISKNRTIYLYDNKYEFSFDIASDIGLIIEIELISKSDSFDDDFNELLELIRKLKIDLNLIERKKYIDYLLVKDEKDGIN